MRKTLFKENRILFILYGLTVCLCVLILMLYLKKDIHLSINKLNNSFLDIFFRYFTEFGAFLLIAPIILLLAFKSYRIALTAVSSSLLAMILVQVAKRLIWPVSPRPKVFFESLQELHLVDNVHLHSWHSFPSGHTTAAFALFMVIALFNKKPYIKVACFIMACLVGYSRMYLSQHFLIDVVAGSFIGAISALVCYLWFTSTRLNKVFWLDQSFRIPLKRSIH
jgi:membrane-associated phospholipid phosphatase